MGNYKDKTGPIPLDHFENDPGHKSDEELEKSAPGLLDRLLKKFKPKPKDKKGDG
jgi:hypothetical protein